MSHNDASMTLPGPAELKGDGTARLAMTIGAGALAVATLVALLSGKDAAGRFFSAYLVNFAFYLSIALGCLFFVLIQHLCRAGWSVSVRRLAETLAATMPILALLFLPVVLGLLAFDLYHWTHATDAISQGKAAYLNVPFFLARFVLYFAVWSGLALWYRKQSMRQDQDGSPALTLSMQRFSAPATLAFALTITFAAFDLLMSLDNHWFSTIFGIYFFAGAFLAGVATLILCALLAQRVTTIGDAVHVEHFHDMGKLLFAFVFFWGYIAYSQYMLIWYANIAEETGWLVNRGVSTAAGVDSSFSWLSLVLLFGHFILPFAGLMSRHVKRRTAFLGVWALWILIIHWLDLVWLVRPELKMDGQIIPVTGLDMFFWAALATGLGGVFLSTALFIARRGSILAHRDPRLVEAVSFQQSF